MASRDQAAADQPSNLADYGHPRLQPLRTTALWLIVCFMKRGQQIIGIEQPTHTCSHTHTTHLVSQKC